MQYISSVWSYSKRPMICKLSCTNIGKYAVNILRTWIWLEGIFNQLKYIWFGDIQASHPLWFSLKNKIDWLPRIVGADMTSVHDCVQRRTVSAERYNMHGALLDEVYISWSIDGESMYRKFHIANPFMILSKHQQFTQYKFSPVRFSRLVSSVLAMFVAHIPNREFYVIRTAYKQEVTRRYVTGVDRIHDWENDIL